MKALRIFLALVILVVLFVFCVNNAQSVQIIFFGYRTPPLPLFLVLVFIFSQQCPYMVSPLFARAFCDDDRDRIAAVYPASF